MRRLKKEKKEFSEVLVVMTWMLFLLRDPAHPLGRFLFDFFVLKSTLSNGFIDYLLSTNECWNLIIFSFCFSDLRSLPRAEDSALNIDDPRIISPFYRHWLTSSGSYSSVVVPCGHS